MSWPRSMRANYLKTSYRQIRIPRTFEIERFLAAESSSKTCDTGDTQPAVCNERYTGMEKFESSLYGIVKG
jgi:hypothetical protein